MSGIALAHADIARCLRGICGWEAAADGALLPRRCSPAQLAMFTALPPRLARGRCTAGCSVDLVTDAQAIGLELRFADRVRQRVAVDVWVDGVPWSQHAAAPACDSLPLRLAFADRRERRITVWLPHYAETRIAGCVLEDASAWRPAPRAATRMLALGDSITQGMDCPAPAATWPALVAARLGHELLNQGIGGYVFASGFVDPTVISDPTLITVAFGTNDWSGRRSAAAIGEEARAMLARIRAAWPTARVLAICPIVRHALPEPLPPESLAEVGAAILAAAAATGCDGLPGADVLPDDRALLVDGVHPGERGSVVYADAVLRRLG